MSLATIQAVVFDMDGLLLDSERVVQKAWTIAGDRLGYDNLGASIYGTLGFNVQYREIFFREHFGIDFPFEKFQEYNREAFWNIVKEEGLKAKPGARELLEYLTAKGYKKAVATSAREEYARLSLERIEVLHYFDAVVFGGMVKNSKPAPDSYLKAAKLLQIEPSGCLALEDAPNGVKSAHAAGMKVIMIPDLVQPDNATKELLYGVGNTLHDIIPLLENKL